tara:strand:- start:452 stop:754 length:303 start_codon:yes stop_codon:yes gene_type:complete
MLRSELVLKIQKKYPSLSLSDIEKIIDLFLKKIFKGLLDGKKIEIRGFGTFSKKINKEKYVRNPKTNERIYKNKTNKIHFKIGKILHNKINPEKLSSNEG